MGRLIFKELLQEACTPEAIAGELIRLTSDEESRTAMQHQYTLLRRQLGCAGAASRIASAMQQ
jgi:lipid A disaccharide synthetase